MNIADNCRRVIVAALTTTLVVMAAPGWAQSGAASNSRAVSPARTLVVPASQLDPTLNSGCWVQLMDNVDKPKQREYLTIMGSKSMPALQTASGKNWAGRADGISIGPNAIATVYSEHAYGGRSAVLQPNQIIQDLRASRGPVDSIESMQVECRSS